MRQSRTDYLQSLWDTLRPAQYAAATLEYRPFKGWYVVHDEPAYFGDNGMYVGDNWKEAEEYLRWLCGKRAA